MNLEKFLLKTMTMVNWNTVRGSTRFIQNETKGKQLLGAEVGVYYGRHALNILKHLPIEKLYLVDPYREYEGIDGPPNKDFEIIWNLAHKNLRKYNEKIIWIRDLSKNAVQQIPDHSLDFVYIDGNHEYQYVKQDLQVWYPKIKPGGVLSGHDYNLFDVSKAVIEFCNAQGLTPSLSGYPIDWWMKKPEDANE